MPLSAQEWWGLVWWKRIGKQSSNSQLLKVMRSIREEPLLERLPALVEQPNWIIRMQLKEWMLTEKPVARIGQPYEWHGLQVMAHMFKARVVAEATDATATRVHTRNAQNVYMHGIGSDQVTDAAHVCSPQSSTHLCKDDSEKAQKLEKMCTAELGP